MRRRFKHFWPISLSRPLRLGIFRPRGATGPRAARACSPAPGRAIGRAARKKRDAYWCAGAAAPRTAIHTSRPQKRGARKTKAEDVTHTLPTHCGRAATAGAREADGACPTQFERDRTNRPRSKDSSSTATCRSRPLPPFGRRECRAPVNRDSAIDVRDWTGPERGASPEARCRAACQTRSPAAGVQAAGNGSAFDWLSRARRAPSDFPSPVAPPPSCGLVATCGGETR